MSEIERLTLHGSHAEVGAYILGIWGLPIGIVSAVARHHEPVDPAHMDPANIVKIVGLLFAEDAHLAHAGIESETDRAALTLFPESRLAVWRCLRDSDKEETPCP